MIIFQKLIKNPRKQHTCRLCGMGITGEHLRFFQVAPDVYSWREHLQCHERMLEWYGGSGCEDPCFYDDCWLEMERFKNEYKKEVTK